jgi:hypothetical protein
LAIASAGVAGSRPAASVRSTNCRRVCAIGRDCDHKWRAVDDGAKGEITEVRLVDHVTEHASRLRRRLELPRLRVRLERADGKRAALHGDAIPWHAVHDHRTGGRRRGGLEQFAGWVGGVDVDMRARSGQQLHLPCRRGMAACDEHALAVHSKKNTAGEPAPACAGVRFQPACAGCLACWS